MRRRNEVSGGAVDVAGTADEAVTAGARVSRSLLGGAVARVRARRAAARAATREDNALGLSELGRKASAEHRTPAAEGTTRARVDTLLTDLRGGDRSLQRAYDTNVGGAVWYGVAEGAHVVWGDPAQADTFPQRSRFVQRLLASPGGRFSDGELGPTTVHPEGDRPRAILGGGLVTDAFVTRATFVDEHGRDPEQHGRTRGATQVGIGSVSEGNGARVFDYFVDDGNRLSWHRFIRGQEVFSDERQGDPEQVRAAYNQALEVLAAASPSAHGR